MDSRVNQESIKQAPSASLPASSARDVLDGAEVVDSPVPDWCNFGLMLRVVVGVNLLFLCIAALRAATLLQWLEQWLGLAMLVEPVLIASLFFGCLMRRLTETWPNKIQFALALALPAFLAYFVQRALVDLIETSNIVILRNAGFAVLIAAATVYWAKLRERAYSPALAEARLQALQSRIRPHFLFNSLNAVLGLIRTDPRRAETALEDIADLFRVLMRDSRERVPLVNEIDLCKQYLAIETLRLGERLRVQWNVDDAALPALVPTLLLQPLIENAVHHGIEPATGGGVIEIDITRLGRYVDIFIVNPWHGDDVALATRGNRMGLDNVRQRLALVHDLEASIDATMGRGRYTVKIRFPAERRRASRVSRAG